jgi:hypothetical protein
MVVLDAGAHVEHVNLIRCGFKPGSVEKCGDAENHSISLKSKGYILLIERMNTIRLDCDRLRGSIAQLL